jgi:flagellar biosynthesis protein FliR
MGELQAFLTSGVFAFIIAFVRLGIIVMLMPGIGNTFVPPQTRLYFALAFSFVLFPLIQAKLPSPVPTALPMAIMIGTEFLIGFFIGSISRILMSAMDVAGVIVSTQASLSNAQLFNPQFASQGSVVGTFLTLVAVLVLFATNLYHMLIMGIVESYEIFPVGKIPDTAGMMELIVSAVAGAFSVGIQITAPFILIILLLYIGMAVLSKLMPQVQIFMIAMPVQILLSLVLLAITGSALMMVWLAEYQKGIGFFLSAGG